jgi:hypothetical protein
MHECRAKYKAAQTKSGVGLTWISFQEKKCGIHAKATLGRHSLPRPKSAEVRPPQLAASFNCHRAGAPPPITAPPLRFRARLNLVPASMATSQRAFRCLIPAAPAVPATAAKQQNDKYDDEKRGAIHVELLRQRPACFRTSRVCTATTTNPFDPYSFL